MQPGFEDVEEPFFQWARDNADVSTGLLLRRVSMNWCRQMGRLRRKHRNNSAWHGRSKATTEISRRLSREVDCIEKATGLFIRELINLDPYSGKMPEPTGSCACSRCNKVRVLLAQIDILEKEGISIHDTWNQDDPGTMYNIYTCCCTTICCDENGEHQCIDKEQCIKQFSLRRCRCSTFKTGPSSQRCLNGKFCTTVFVEPEECCGGGIMSDSEEGEEEDDDSEDDSGSEYDSEGDEGSDAE